MAKDKDKNKDIVTEDGVTYNQRGDVDLNAPDYKKKKEKKPSIPIQVNEDDEGNPILDI